MLDSIEVPIVVLVALIPGALVCYAVLAYWGAWWLHQKSESLSLGKSGPQADSGSP
jgi:hypothetical protein